MNYVTFKEREITDNPAIIEGLVFACRNSEARTRTFIVPEPPQMENTESIDAPKKPKNAKSK